MAVFGDVVEKLRGMNFYEQQAIGMTTTSAALARSPQVSSAIRHPPSATTIAACAA